jgi:hypothetical protein
MESMSENDSTRRRLHGHRVGGTCLAAFVKAPASRSKSALSGKV